MPLKLKNFSVEQFNRDVNRSHDPDSQFHRWADYRQQVSGFIQQIVGSADRSGQIIVLGAGSQNDVDLPFLCDRFEKVELTDIDATSMEQGIAQHHLTEEQRARITIRELDYSGARAGGFFQLLESLSSQSAPVETILAAMTEAMASLKPDRVPESLAFDYVLSCPVYTQLLYTQIEVWLKILHTCGLYTLPDLNRILVAAHQGMTAVLQRYNQLMLSLMKPDGKLIVLADILELAADDALLSDIQDNPGDLLISPVVQDRIECDGLDFTQIARADLEKQIIETDSRGFLWPFNGQKSYLVYGLSGHRSDRL